MNKKPLGVLIALITAAVPVFGQDNNILTAGRTDDDRVQMRLIHAVPNAPSASISIGGTELFSNVAFKQVTGYKVMPEQDDQKVLIKLEDGRQLQTTEEFDFDDDDQLYTVLITPDESGPNPKVIVLQSDDDTGETRTGDVDEIEVTVINASPEHKSIKVQLDDDDMVDGVDYGKSDDEDVKRGSYTLKVLGTEGSDTAIATQPVSFTGAGSYTVLVLGQDEVQVVNDLSPEQPTGAGATGMETTTGSASMMTPGSESMTATGTDTMMQPGATPPSEENAPPGTESNSLMSTMPVTSPGL